MKNLILLLILAASAAQGQIGISKVEKKTVIISDYSILGSFVCKMTQTIYKDSPDTIYTITLPNEKYRALKDIKTFAFVSSSADMESLYLALKSFYLPENMENKDYALSLKLGDEPVTLSSSKTLGVRFVFLSYNNGYSQLNEKSIDKLFGKR